MNKVLAVIFYVTVCAFSKSYAAALSEGNQWAHRRAAVVAHPEIHYGEFENGFSYAWHQAKMPVELHEIIGCQIYLHVNVGSWQEEDDERGMAHFLEHMAFKGGRLFPKDTMIQSLQMEGLSFGAHQNAHTTHSETVYKFTIQRCTPERVKTIFEALRDIADGLMLDERDVNDEKAVIDAEERFRAPDGLTEMALRIDDRALPLGKKSVRDTFTADKVRAFYEKWYIPQHMKLLVVGDVPNLDVLVTPHLALFASMKRGLEQARRPMVGEAVGSTSIVPVGAMPMAQGTMGRFTSRSLATRSVNEIIAHEKRIIVANILYERMKNIKQVDSTVAIALMDQTTYIAEGEIELWSVPRMPLFGLFCLALLRNQDLASVFAYWHHTLDDIFANGFSIEEFSSVAWQKLSTLATSKSSAKMMIDMLLNDARGFIPPLSEEQLRELILPELQKFSKVEAEQVLRELLQGPATTMLSGQVQYHDEKSFLADMALARDSIGVTKSFAQRKKRRIAYAYPASDQRTSYTNRIQHDGFTSLDFSNGVRLLHRLDVNRPTDFQISITAKGMFPLHDRKSKILSDEAIFCMQKLIGIATHTPEELREIFGEEFHNYWVSYAASSVTIFSQGRGAKKRDVLQQLELLSGYFIDPTIHENKFFSALTEQMARRSQTPFSPFHQFLLEVFGEDIDTKLVPPSSEELARVAPADLMKFYHSFLFDGPLEIYYTGPDDVEVVIDAVSRTFGTLKPRSGSNDVLVNEVSPPSVAMRSGKIMRVSEASSAKQFLMMVFPVCSHIASPLDEPTHKALQALTHLIEQRIIDTVRKKLGATYSVNVNLMNGRVYGYCYALQIFLDVDPARSELIIDHLLSLIDGVAEGEIDDGEFARASAQTDMQLSSITVDKEAIRVLARTILRREFASYAW